MKGLKDNFDPKGSVRRKRHHFLKPQSGVGIPEKKIFIQLAK